GAAADHLVLVLDRGGPGARRDDVIGRDGARGDRVGERGALLVTALAAEVGAVAGVRGAGGEADQGQGRGRPRGLFFRAARPLAAGAASVPDGELISFIPRECPRRRHLSTWQGPRPHVGIRS